MADTKFITIGGRKFKVPIGASEPTLPPVEPTAPTVESPVDNLNPPTIPRPELPSTGNPLVDQRNQLMSQMGSPSSLLQAVKDRLVKDRQQNIQPLEERRLGRAEELSTLGTRSLGRTQGFDIGSVREVENIQRQVLRTQVADLDRRIDDRQKTIDDNIRLLSEGVSEEAESQRQILDSLIVQQQQDFENKNKLRELELKDEQFDFEKKITLAEMSKLGLGKPPTITEQLAAEKAGFDIEGGLIVDRPDFTPTGEFQTATYNDRPITLDSVASPSLSGIDSEAQGISVNGQTGLVTGAIDSSTFRTPEQQKALFDQGVSPLDGTTGISKHQEGLAIDLFPDENYIAQMKPIMESNGWKQTVSHGDNGHFEYVGTGTAGDRPRKDAILAQISNGLLTKGDATAIRDEFGNDAAFLTEVTQAFNDPKNRAIGEKATDKFDTPTNITRGQFDDTIEARQDAGFGNKKFQGLDDKEYGKIVSWLEMRKDLRDMRSLKEGDSFINTLPEDQQLEVRQQFGLKEGYDGLNTGVAETFRKKTGEKLGPFGGLISGDLAGNKKAFIDLDTLSGKYTVEFMRNASGVAISEQEANRLQTLVPNTKQEDVRFTRSAKDAMDELDNTLLATANIFGFNSIDAMRSGTQRTRAGEYYDVGVPESVSSGETSSGIKYNVIQN